MLLYTVGLFDGDKSAVFAEWRLKQCSTLFAVVRRWLDGVIMSLGG